MQWRSDSIRGVLYNPGWVGGHRGGLSLACLADFRSTTNSSGVFICSQVISRPDHPLILKGGSEGGEGQGRRKKKGKAWRKDELLSAPRWFSAFFLKRRVKVHVYCTCIARVTHRWVIGEGKEKERKDNELFLCKTVQYMPDKCFLILTQFSNIQRFCPDKHTCIRKYLSNHVK